MNQEIAIGIKHTEITTVTPEKTAKALASGALEVYATPAMIAFMEYTAMNCVKPFLPETHGTVGIEVCIRHLKASKVGSKIVCNALLSERKDNKLVFEVEAFDGDILVGKGTHTRYIVDNAKFIENLNK